MSEIERADPRTRRKAIMLLVIAGALGAIALWGLERHREGLLSWMERNVDAIREHSLLVAAGIFVVFSPIAAFALYLLRIGRRTIDARRFPPPGLAVIRDTPVVEGTSAIARGRWIQVLAVLLLAAALVLPYLAWRLLEIL